MKKLSRSIFTASLILATSIAMAKTETSAEDIKRELVTYDNVQIEVNTQGKGPIIVMLPSLGRSVRDYDEVATDLARAGFRVVRPEPRGIGQSKGPMENLSLHDFARDIAEVVENENEGPVVVVGHAWGNFAARQLATDRPDLVRGIVLAAASAGKVPEGSNEKPINAEIRQAIDGAGDRSLSKEQRLTYLRKAFFAPGSDASVWLDGWHDATHEAEERARINTPIDEYFAGGSAPILDLQARDDTVAPRRFAGVLKEALGERVQVVVIENAGHALVPEQPKAMANAITAFAKIRYAE